MGDGHVGVPRVPRPAPVLPGAGCDAEPVVVTDGPAAGVGTLEMHVHSRRRPPPRVQPARRHAPPAVSALFRRQGLPGPVGHERDLPGVRPPLRARGGLLHRRDVRQLPALAGAGVPVLTSAVHAPRPEAGPGRGRDRPVGALGGGVVRMPIVAHDPTVLPPDLPVPLDDGAAGHLLGAAVPDVALPSTDGRSIALAGSGAERTIVYAYPRTGRPGEPPLVADWDRIPGARGCTPESCGFRDHHDELRALGAEVS